MRRAPLICSLAIVLGCSSSDPESSAPKPTDPSAPGPYAVGVATIETSSEGRTLPVEVWYPAEIEAGAPVVEYPVTVGVIELAQIPSGLGAVRDASIDPERERYPVVLFSHGNGGMRVQSVYLTEYLASHGFVVAAPDHVGNTIAEQVNAQKALPPAEAARVRPIDISRTLDALLEDARFGPRVDPERVGVAGHSFGGYTAFRLAGATLDVEAVKQECASGGDLFCTGWDELGGPFPESARDPRIIAALPQTPGGAEIIDAGFSAVEIPTMVQGGTTDDTTPFEPESRAPFELLSGPAWLIGIERAGHFTFSNVCQLMEEGGFSLDELEDGCTAEDIPWRDAHALVTTHATAFFQVHVAGHGELAAWLERPEPLPPGLAVFEARP